MPENPKNADFEFFDKLTKDTLNTNEDLKEYYNKIESIYNGYFICRPGQEAEVREYEATETTEDYQCSESDISFHNDQTHNTFLSKFADALGKLLAHYDESSLLQHDHIKHCVYFKYWFYDKIIKNILSDRNLHEFYEALEDEDKDLENQEVSASVKEEDREKLEVVYLEQDIEEEEEFEDGSSLDSEEDGTEESEDTQQGKSKHKYKSEDNDSDEILLSLDISNHCNIYKLELNQIKYIKILYDYLEDINKNRSYAKEKISKSNYCSSFNETIKLYNKKSKCRIDDLDNEYCQEVEECKKIYPLTNVHILECAKAEPTTDSSQRSSINNELQEATNAPSSTGLPDRSDSTRSSPSSDVSHVVSESSKGVGFIYLLIPPEPADFVLTTQHTCDDMGKKYCLGKDEQVIQSHQPHTGTSSLRDIGESHTTTFTSSTSCPHDNGKVGRSCESSSQSLAPMSTKTRNHLNELPQEKTDMRNEPDVSLQEENGNTNTIVSSASSVLGVSALLFMLYKFTPLGSLINNRRGGINTWDINEEGYDENLLFSSALGNTNSNNNNYSIGYYSLGNT
ncbi:PIR Superfamily Protein [Plasmodium ovale curtisi]|uniref:PIR Superfamily Protein n=1 Tax=Plasmodium ovale curtisi TaxID=864141 RepID=A0A1A8WPR3_PLAOA|nr:PIR Superfamily Protein [Plasmodium ovale curtisi]SBS99915.1 PIR Superfamily Protein [Plasmodium ovale curtisi]